MNKKDLPPVRSPEEAKQLAGNYPEKAHHLAYSLKTLRESQQHIKPYTADVCGKTFLVMPNVFAPTYFMDTPFFAENLPIQEGESFLEIGSGTGVVSIMAALKGAGEVYALDINPSAVENTRRNIFRFGLDNKMMALQSDVYDSLPPGKKFDTIFWNVPFGVVDEELSDLEKAVFDQGYESVRRFIVEAKDRLKEGGRLLLGFSTDEGRFELIEKFAKEGGLEIKLLEEKAIINRGHAIKFEIFEMKPKTGNKRDIEVSDKKEVDEKNSAQDIKFEVPFNWEPDFLDFLETHKDKVHSVYGSLPGEATGRPIPHSSSVNKSAITTKYFAEVVDRLKKLGIDFNLVMNATCNANTHHTNEGKKRIKEKVERISDIGINTVTVANFDLARRISDINSEIRIMLSIIFNITQLDQIRYARRQDFNLQGVLVGKGLNRNLPLLKRFLDRTKDLDAIAIANDFCPSANCPERITDHNNSCAHKNMPMSPEYGEQYYVSPSTNCRAMTLQDPAYFLRAPVINPNDLAVYADAGVKTLKLTDRIMPSKKLMEICDAYFGGEYDGNLFDLFSYTGHFDNTHLPQRRLSKEEVRKIVQGGYQNLASHRNLFRLNPFLSARALSESGFMKPFEKGACDHDCYHEEVAPSGCQHCDNYADRFLEIDEELKDIVLHNIKTLQAVSKQEI